MRAGPHRLDRAVDRAVGGDRDDPGFRLQGLDVAHQFKAITIRQDQVQQHHHRPMRAELLQPVLGGSGDSDAVTGGGQDRPIDHLQGQGVFDQQHRRPRERV